MGMFLEALESLSILMLAGGQLSSKDQAIFESLMRASRVPAKVNRYAQLMFRAAGGTLSHE